MPNPYQAQIEALQAAANPEIPNARKMLDMIKHMAEPGIAVADMLRGNAAAIDEQIPVDPAVTEMIESYARHQQVFAEDMREIDAQTRRAHAQQIEAIENPQPNAEKWDVSLNRE